MFNVCEHAQLCLCLTARLGRHTHLLPVKPAAQRPGMRPPDQVALTRRRTSKASMQLVRLHAHQRSRTCCPYSGCASCSKAQNETSKWLKRLGPPPGAPQHTGWVRTSPPGATPGAPAVVCERCACMWCACTCLYVERHAAASRACGKVPACSYSGGVRQPSTRQVRTVW